MSASATPPRDKSLCVFVCVLGSDAQERVITEVGRRAVHVLIVVIISYLGLGSAGSVGVFVCLSVCLFVRVCVCVCVVFVSLYVLALPSFLLAW